jgi:hypothetical protein
MKYSTRKGEQQNYYLTSVTELPALALPNNSQYDTDNYVSGCKISTQ